MRRGEIKEEKETRRRSSKAGAKIDIATTLSVVKEANTSSASNNQACFNGRSGENKYGNDKRTRTWDISKKRSLCDGGEQEKELLHLQRIQAHSPSLQKQGRKGSRRKEIGV